MAYGPAEIDEVLTDRAADFRKSFGTGMLIPLLGNGLLTAEGDEWLRHRRLTSGRSTGASRGLRTCDGPVRGGCG